jgi:hypothetical protein
MWRGKVVLVIPHQGLGDHIICNGLYRQLALRSRRVYLVVKKSKHNQVKLMLRDLANIYFVQVPDKYEWKSVDIIQLIAKFLKIETVSLGFYGQSFFEANMRFDSNFYHQAKIDFIHRWKSFEYLRDEKKEMELFRVLVSSNEPYIFLHEDAERGFLIDRDKVNSSMRIIEPLKLPSRFHIFDYFKIIELAREVHLIESSFAAFVESLNFKCSKFAHRYSRPEASNDFRHEFTYASDWTILR